MLVAPVGGLPEVVSELSESPILPETGAAAMADRIATAILRPSSLPSPEECVSYARRRFAWPVVARQVREVYSEVTA